MMLHSDDMSGYERLHGSSILGLLKPGELIFVQGLDHVLENG